MGTIFSDPHGLPSLSDDRGRKLRDSWDGVEVGYSGNSSCSGGGENSFPSPWVLCVSQPSLGSHPVSPSSRPPNLFPESVGNHFFNIHGASILFDTQS